MTYNANIYCGLDFRISFENTDSDKLNHAIVDWGETRFPDGLLGHNRTVKPSIIIDTFYDEYNRMWTIIRRATK